MKKYNHRLAAQLAVQQAATAMHGAHGSVGAGRGQLLSQDS
jgi:hypothetical protein